MNFQHHGLETSPDNVIAFPGTHRVRTRAADIAHSLPSRRQRAAALSGAALNGRLLLLLGICVSSSAILLSAVHVLQRYTAL